MGRRVDARQGLRAENFGVQSEGEDELAGSPEPPVDEGRHQRPPGAAAYQV